jgi:hypothetical protein
VPLSRTEAFDVIAQIKELTTDFGHPNVEASARLVRLVSQLRVDGPDDGYYREKLFNVEHFAGIGFSAKKFSKFPGGASQVRVGVLGDLGVVESIVAQYWPRP